MKRVRIGVVGLGAWGQHHVRLYHQFPDVELAGVVSLDPDEIAHFSRRYRAPGFLDHRDLLGRVDAVSIVAPTVHHYAIARDFLEAGVHVLVEKPITANVGDASELVALARARERVLLVGHVERFKPAIRALFEMAREPLFVQARRVRPYQPGRNTDVGVVLDLMTHDLDIVLSLTRARVARVSAIGARVHGGDEDLAIAHLELDTGCLVSLVASRISTVKAAGIEIVLPDAVVFLDYLREQFTVRRGTAIERFTVNGAEPLREELRHFVACVRGEAEPLVPGEDGRAALALALRICEEMTLIVPPARV